MQDQGSFPVANHSVSRILASTFDPKRSVASFKATESQTPLIVLGVLAGLAMALSRGLLRAARVFQAPWAAGFTK
jgi:hypothetical protein